jgi:hypothetical protein
MSAVNETISGRMPTSAIKTSCVSTTRNPVIGVSKGYTMEQFKDGWFNLKKVGVLYVVPPVQHAPINSYQSKSIFYR